MKEANGKFKYERDTQRYHRFIIADIDSDTEVKGTLYIAKGHAGLPKRIVLEYQERE